MPNDLKVNLYGRSIATREIAEVLTGDTFSELAAHYFLMCASESLAESGEEVNKESLEDLAGWMATQGMHDDDSVFLEIQRHVESYVKEV